MSRGHIYAFLSPVVAVTITVFARLLKAEGWSSWEILAVRGLFGALFLAIIYRKDILDIRHDLKYGLIYVVLTVFCSTAYVTSILFAPIGIALSVLFLGPVWVVIYEQIRDKTFRPVLSGAVALAFLGTILIALGMDLSEAGNLLGLVMAFFASLGFAMFLLIGRRASLKVKPQSLAMWGLASLFVVYGWFLPWSNWTLVTLSYSLGLGIISGGVFFLLYLLALRLISSSEMGVIQYLEVFMGWLIGWLVFREQPTIAGAFGAAAIIIAGIIVALTPTTQPSS